MQPMKILHGRQTSKSYGNDNNRNAMSVCHINSDAIKD